MLTRRLRKQPIAGFQREAAPGAHVANAVGGITTSGYCASATRRRDRQQTMRGVRRNATISGQQKFGQPAPYGERHTIGQTALTILLIGDGEMS